MASFEDFKLKKVEGIDYDEKTGLRFKKGELFLGEDFVGKWKQNKNKESTFESSLLTKKDLKNKAEQLKEKIPQLFNLEGVNPKEKINSVEWEDFLIALNDLSELERFYKKHKILKEQKAYFYINGNEIYKGIVGNQSSDEVFEYLKEQRKERHKSPFKKEHLLLTKTFEF